MNSKRCTLDLIITRSDDADFLLRDVYMSSVLLFDHSSILFKLNHRPPPRKITGLLLGGLSVCLSFI